MKKTKFYFGLCSLIVAAMFAACSENAIKGEEPDEPVKDDGTRVYMTLDISTLTTPGARSTTNSDGTSSDGVEVGQDSENKISSIMVVLVGRQGGKDNCQISKWTKVLDETVDIKGDGQTFMADFSRSDLIAHYGAHEAGASSNVAVYVICNYSGLGINSNIVSSKLKDWSDTDAWQNLVINTSNPAGGDYTNSTMPFWQPNKFLMSNATYYTSSIPTLEELESNKYNSISNPFPLTFDGAIPVERAMARFDYAPTIAESEAVLDNSNNLYYYKIADAQNADASKGQTAQPEIRAYLTRMSLVNMSRKFYLFRRTSATGSSTEWQIGGTEAPTNFIVDPEWSWKRTATAETDKSEYTKRFHYWVNDLELSSTGGNIMNNSWYSQNISEVTKNPRYDGTYHFWRYVIPNTIPEDATTPGSNQKAGISTGIVFKARIEAMDPTVGVGAHMAAGYDIFAFQGKIVGSWEDVQNLAKSDHESNADLRIAYNNVVAKQATLGNKSNDWNKFNDTTHRNLIKTIVDNGFTRFRKGKDDSGTDGYFCNYYYWNRHNDNNKATQMGTMEFGVVRNNVYKLAVTRLKRLGHPIDPSNDPDPVDPDDPDEKSEVYFTVSVKVLPWTVRKNNITFD